MRCRQVDGQTRGPLKQLFRALPFCKRERFAPSGLAYNVNDKIVPCVDSPASAVIHKYSTCVGTMHTLEPVQK